MHVKIIGNCTKLCSCYCMAFIILKVLINLEPNVHAATYDIGDTTLVCVNITDCKLYINN